MTTVRAQGPGLRFSAVLFLGLAACGRAGAATRPPEPTQGAPAPDPGYVDGRDDPELMEVLGQLDQARRQARVPGATYVVLRRGKTPVVHSQGVIHVGTGEPVTPDTRFAIASLTKAFTAALALHVRDEGLLELSKHPSQCLDGFKVIPEARDRTLTLRDLLAHTSGHPRDSGVIILQGTPDQLVDHVQTMDPLPAHVAEVGEGYHYSNAMFAVAGYCVERALQTPYEDALREHILAPLGMVNAGFDHGPGDAWGHVAIPAYPGGDGVAATPERFYPIAFEVDPGTPGGRLLVSGVEMVKWMEYWRDLGRGHPRLMSPRSVADAVRPRLGLNKRNSGYGLGWGAGFPFRRRAITHTGSVFGQKSVITIFPEDQAGVLVLANGSHGQFHRVASRRLIAHVVGDEEAKAPNLEAKPPRAAPTDVSLRRSASHPLAGLYLKVPNPDKPEPGPPIIERIVAEGDKLYLGLDRVGDRPLALDSDSRMRRLPKVEGSTPVIDFSRGQAFSILRDRRGLVTGIRNDNGTQWIRVAESGGGDRATKRLRKAAFRAHGSDAYPRLLPLRTTFEKPLPWYGATSRGAVQTDRTLQTIRGSWTAGDLARPWWRAVLAPAGEPIRLREAWRNDIVDPPDPNALDRRAMLDLDPVGWSWDTAQDSLSLGQLTLPGMDGAVDLVIHAFRGGHLILDAYDAKTHRLAWRRLWYRPRSGQRRSEFAIFEGWAELEGVLLPTRIYEGARGRDSAQTFADYKARVVWPDDPLAPPDGVRAPRVAVELHPNAARALAL